MSEYLDRKQVIDLYEKFQPSLATHVYEFGEALRKLPVTQDSHGEWVLDQEFSFIIDMYKCSKCRFNGSKRWHFCPNCGADMRKEGETE